MKHVLSVILLIAACIGMALSIGMLIVAVRFREIGRVLFYGVIAILCLELAVFSLVRVRKKKT